jgi:hypothetical protein
MGGLDRVTCRVLGGPPELAICQPRAGSQGLRGSRLYREIHVIRGLLDDFKGCGSHPGQIAMNVLKTDCQILT